MDAIVRTLSLLSWGAGAGATKRYLPLECTRRIASYCTASDVSELEGWAFEDGGHEILATPVSWCTRVQYEALKVDFAPWGETLDDVIENGDMGIWRCTVGFHRGYAGSGDLLVVDVVMGAEFHHWHAPFVFVEGTGELILRYGDPPVFCVDVARPDRAAELSGLFDGLMFEQMEHIVDESSGGDDDDDDRIKRARVV